jgi:hypothetical protein
MPLAKGVPVVDTAWLSQAIGYLVHRSAGPTGLQFLHALCITGCCVVLVFAIRRRTHGTVPVYVGLLLLLGTQWFQWRIIRPQVAGQLACILLIHFLAAREYRRPSFVFIPILFAVWGNTHGSFVMGIALMILTAAGRGIDLVIRSGSVRGSIEDPFLRRLLMLLLLAVLGTLVNPYGFSLYREVVEFSWNPNLRDLLEWAPLSFATWQGRTFAVVAALTVISALINRRHLRFREGIPLVVLTLATLVSARFIVWWGPLAACGLARGVDLVLKRATGHRVRRTARSLGWTVAAGLALFAALGFTPLARRLATGDEQPLDQIVSSRTPVAAVDWLREHPQEGQMFNSYEWGDYLVWAGPVDVEVFVTSHVHVIPPTVWRDYRAISRDSGRWQEGLNRYAVRTALIDLGQHSRLAKAMSASIEWREIYRDRQAVVFERR